ncbi:hypothetical protein ACFLWX_04420 [Chloroflexota bacterium]
MVRKTLATCHTCSRKAEYTECSPEHGPPRDAPCKVLTGWLTVFEYECMGDVEEYDFCSFLCLQRWVDGQVPKIPEVFLKGFEEG